ncbi:hypothetical protein ECANGB1_1866 [Enterospora canceri]|uniref:Uncharacterized protein n=1 Tax=Enterospora canceri TaxID=1081671 RepID=A0A1Y1S5E7_9MICR|nr:hypothetical protein ECANGB1_1866 [Enterospora canceri]
MEANNPMNPFEKKESKSKSKGDKQSESDSVEIQPIFPTLKFHDDETSPFMSGLPQNPFENNYKKYIKMFEMLFGDKGTMINSKQDQIKSDVIKKKIRMEKEQIEARNEILKMRIEDSTISKIEKRMNKIIKSSRLKAHKIIIMYESTWELIKPGNMRMKEARNITINTVVDEIRRIATACSIPSRVFLYRPNRSGFMIEISKESGNKIKTKVIK